MKDLVLSQEIYNEYYLLFINNAYQNGRYFHLSINYKTEVKNFDVLHNLSRYQPQLDILFDADYEDWKVIVITSSENTYYLKLRESDLTIEIASTSISERDKCLVELKELIPEMPEPDSENARVKFWYLSTNGPSNVVRDLEVPSWESIKPNYGKTTFEGLNNLITKFNPDANSGKIILWHGLPGTGKTYALRALIREWRDWLSAEYILDPESLFGHSAGYLAQMIFSNPVDFNGGPEVYGEEPKERWKLLILEDTGELLSDDAKDRAGQGLSRLLNLADGFIGQGLKTLVLITTNEELDKLHPAVAREGRCAAAIHFSEMTQGDAESWAEHYSIPLNQRKNSWTLADLYALRSDAKIEVVQKVNKIGFGEA